MRPFRFGSSSSGSSGRVAPTGSRPKRAGAARAVPPRFAREPDRVCLVSTSAAGYAWSFDARQAASSSAAAGSSTGRSVPPPPPPPPRVSSEVLLTKETRLPAGGRLAGSAPRPRRNRTTAERSSPTAALPTASTPRPLLEVRAHEQREETQAHPRIDLASPPVDQESLVPEQARSSATATEPSVVDSPVRTTPAAHPLAGKPSLAAWGLERPLGWTASPTHPHYAERAFRLPGSQRRFALLQAVDAELLTPAGRFVSVGFSSARRHDESSADFPSSTLRRSNRPRSRTLALSAWPFRSSTRPRCPFFGRSRQDSSPYGPRWTGRGRSLRASGRLSSHADCGQPTMRRRCWLISNGWSIRYVVPRPLILDRLA